MALNFLLKACSLTKTLLIQSNAHEYINHSSRVLAGYLQTREMGKLTRKRRSTHAPRWWTIRKRKHTEDYLTRESKDFVQEVIQTRALKPGESPLKEPPWQKGEWALNSIRSGVIARKIGIYPMWTKDGKRVLSTLLQIVDNHVIRYHPPETYDHTFTKPQFKGMGVIVVGAETADPQLFTASYLGLFTESGILPKRKLTRFYITPNSALQPGTPLTAAHYRAGDYVDVYGKTIGHGFQGVVKRWGFKGGPASHGNTKNHRRTGCIGGGSKKAGVWKGKKMPGHMGQERRTQPGLKILRINTKHNVLWVQGPAVPGHVHAYVRITDSLVSEKRHTEDNPPPFPTYYQGENEPPPEESYASDIHVFSDPTITYKEEEAPKKVKVAKK